MPWCPKCRNEYRAGITTCADCGVDLVEDLSVIDDDEKNYEVLFITPEAELAEKFAEYLEYSGINRYKVTDNSEDSNNDSEEGAETSSVKESYFDADVEYKILVHPSDYEAARKLYVGFALTESTNASGGSCQNSGDADFSDQVESGDNETSDMEEIDDIIKSFETDETGKADPSTIDDSEEPVEIGPDHPDIIEPDEIIEQYEEENEMFEASSSTYVRKSDRYKEYKSSAYTCMLCGAVGIIFTVLNMLEVITLFSSLFSEIVMLVMFALFVLGGIYLLIKSNGIKDGIKDEEDKEKKVKTWLSINVTPEYVRGLKFDNVQDEVNYLNYCKTIREHILKDIPDAPVDMVDSLIEDHLSELEG